MPLPHFDHDYVAESVARLDSIPADATPGWGKMTAGELPSHLAGLILYSMGRSEPLKDRSSWFQRNVLKRMLLWGVVSIPKNIRATGAVADRLTPPRTYDVESLHALLDEYLEYVLAGGGDAVPHPILGPFSIDDWASFHCRHFEHHFKQFGV